MLLKPVHQTLEQQLWEFDVWVTPSIVDIRQTERFRMELARILAVLDALTSGGHQELEVGRFAASLVDRAFAYLDATPVAVTVANAQTAVEEFLVSLSALLFLVTGKSDNNHKCQFPIFLKNHTGWSTLHGVRLRNKLWEAIEDPIPRVLDSDVYMARVARLYAVGQSEFAATIAAPVSLRHRAAQLLFQFVECLLADTASREQLSAYLDHYRCAKESGQAPELMLTPLVMFQVRGSVAASGGHEPEAWLRARLTDWGLERGIDFNTTDVVLNTEVGTATEVSTDMLNVPSGKTKTRAYDFVLPYRTPQWMPRLFVQAQFYAGDSGSVSHKNVDQTQSARLTATKLIAQKWPSSPAPRFLEYVDGAGYCASLNGDLKSLLSFSDTAGFFQMRSAPVRLRRELQHIGFLTPLELAHAALRSNGITSDAIALLCKEGYAEPEIQRALDVAVDRGTLQKVGDGAQLHVDPLWRPLVQQYLLLDLIAREGTPFLSPVGLTGVALVPGFGAHYGVKLSQLARCVQRQFPRIWPASFMDDLEALCAFGFVVLR